MTRLASLVMLGTLVACRGGHRASDEAVARMGRTRDAICACKDLTCVDQAQHDHERWAQADPSRIPKGADATKRHAALELEAALCREALEAAAAAATPPPPPVVEEPPRQPPVHGPPIEEIEPSPPPPPGYKRPTSI
jgi:hypothetical protein